MDVNELVFTRICPRHDIKRLKFNRTWGYAQLNRFTFTRHWTGQNDVNGVFFNALI